MSSGQAPAQSAKQGGRKKPRKGIISEMMIGGIGAADEGEERCWVIETGARKPRRRDDLVDILYWSLWKERWVPFGPFGRPTARVDQAVRIVSEAAIFRAGV